MVPEMPVELPCFHVQLPILSTWHNVRLLHKAAVSCLALFVPDVEVCETIGMVVSELCENAIKYSDWSRPERATLVLGPCAPPRSAVEVEVSNPIPRRAEYESVCAMLAWIASFPTPREAYMARVRTIAQHGAMSKESRLGLVRIMSEWNNRVEAELIDDDVLRVKVTIPLVCA